MRRDRKKPQEIKVVLYECEGEDSDITGTLTEVLNFLNSIKRRAEADGCYDVEIEQELENRYLSGDYFPYLKTMITAKRLETPAEVEKRMERYNKFLKENKIKEEQQRLRQEEADRKLYEQLKKRFADG